MSREASRWSRQQTIEQMDTELYERSRAEAPLRLQLGQVLALMGQGACFELGFSSLTAYALERCERNVRWVLAARCLAQRLEALPDLRRAVACGELPWSKAELVAAVATPSDERRWLETAKRLKVRELRSLLKHEATEDIFEEDEDPCILVCTVDREEAWLFEATRALLVQLGTRSTDAQVEALLAEAQVTLLDTAPRGALDLDAQLERDAAERRWRNQLAHWRAESEAWCEANLRQEAGAQDEMKGRVGRACTARRRENPRDSAGPNVIEAAPESAARGYASLEHHTPQSLDNLARALARALAEHEYQLSRIILALHRAEAWGRLGYASEAHYARERLGMPRASFKARRALAAKLEELPLLAEALTTSKIGVEAAQQLVRVATPLTEYAWLERARCRTIKHLREEVAAALAARRISGEVNCSPPAVVEIDAFHDLERAASSGRIWRTTAATTGHPRSEPSGAGQAQEDRGPKAPGRRAWHLMLGSLAEWLQRTVHTSAAPSDPGVQTSAVAVDRKLRSCGRVTFRLRVTRAIQSWWRSLERQARRWLPRDMSFLRFCCLSLWKAWHHLLAPDVAYSRIYIRDRHHCTSPVCSHRDVTPHHIKYRSRGGSDEDDNVTSVCVWCHLLGIHEGRIRASGTANDIRWEIGPRHAPCVVVQGRERTAA